MLLGRLINYPSKIEIKEISDLVLRAQGYKQEAQKCALEKINAHSFDIDKLNIDQLDSLLADLTRGPGNMARCGWDKETFMSKISTYK